MPYAANSDLPPSVREHLPPHAQDIFRAAYNHAWEEYADHSDREAVCNQVAWAAVERKYHKIDDAWVLMDDY
ncbi:ChaB family protein [Dongia sp. agr-C8]